MLEVKANGKTYVFKDGTGILGQLESTASEIHESKTGEIAESMAACIKDGYIYTQHVVEYLIMQAFEDLLEDKEIVIPCEDEEEEANRRSDAAGNPNARIDGTEYADLLETIETTLCNLLDAHASSGVKGYIREKRFG